MHTYTHTHTDAHTHKHTHTPPSFPYTRVLSTKKVAFNLLAVHSAPQIFFCF